MPQASIKSWLTHARPVATEETASTSPESGRSNDLTSNTEQVIVPILENASIVASELALERPKSSLPANLELRSCAKDDVSGVRRLLSLLLPVTYPDKFYKEIIDDEVTNDLTLVALWHDDVTTKGRSTGHLVGMIRGRLLNSIPGTSNPGRPQDAPLLYLSALGILAPYRGHGIAAEMLHVASERAAAKYGAESIVAHVWEANTDGLVWYRNRGFQEIGRDADYYRRLDPHGGVIMHKLIEEPQLN